MIKIYCIRIKSIANEKSNAFPIFELLYLVTFDATSSEFFLIASGTIDFLFPRDEAFGTNWCLANTTAEAWLMPLSCFVFHLLCA